MAQRIKEPTLSVAYVHSLSQELLHAAGGAKKKRKKERNMKHVLVTNYQICTLDLLYREC